MISNVLRSICQIDLRTYGFRNFVRLVKNPLPPCVLYETTSKAEQFIHKTIETGAEYSFGEDYGPVHTLYNFLPL